MATSSVHVLDGQSLKVTINDAAGVPQTIGIFSDVTIGYSFGAKPVYVLGSSAPQVIQRTHQEPVTLRCRAWRINSHGPFKDGGLPSLKAILTNPTTTLSLIDRTKVSPDDVVGKIEGLVITSFDQTATIRDLIEYSFSGMGIYYSDESVKDNTEAAGASVLGTAG